MPASLEASLNDDPFDGASAPQEGFIALHEHGPPPADFGTLFALGLRRAPKSLIGLMLLDRCSPTYRRLCALPEYYPQRTELEILRDQAVGLARAIGPAAQLVDFGQGVGPQIERLLATLDRPWGYVAFGRDREPLLADARRVQRRNPRLWVEAVRADLRIGFDIPPNAGGGRRVGYLPGSAIGNFDPPEALALLSLLRRELGRGGCLLVSVDLRKSPLILESAYDDPHGLNRALMLDVLLRANRELGADFDVRLFEHRVAFDDMRGSVNGDLVSVGQQDVRIAGETFRFEAGEVLHVEKSWKYSLEDFQALARGAGFRPLDMWQDARGLLSLHLLEAGL